MLPVTKREIAIAHLDILVVVVVDHDLAHNVPHVLRDRLARNRLDELRHTALARERQSSGVHPGSDIHVFRARRGGNDTHGMASLSSSFFLGIHEEYSMLTPDESIVISSLCSCLNLSTSCCRVKSPSMKKRSQIVHSVS